MNGQAHVHDLLAAYVLDAVTPTEAALVETHLASCATCRALATDLRTAAEYLPDLASPMDPPPALRSRIMAIVAAESQEQRPRAPRGLASVAPPPSSAVSSRTGDATAAGRAREVRRQAMPLLALAALLVVLLVSITLWKMYSGSPARPTVTYAMAGTAAQPAVGGSLDYYAPATRLQLTVHGLRVLPARQVYELWLIRGHYRLVRAVGTLRPQADGRATLSVQGQDVPGYTMACLTVERAPSAQRPTLPLVAIASITQ